LTRQAEAAAALEERLQQLYKEVLASRTEVVVLEERLQQLSTEAPAAIEERINQLRIEERINQLRIDERINQLRAEALSQQHPQLQTFQGVQERVSRAERKLRRLLYVLTDPQEGLATQTVPQLEPPKISRRSLVPDFDYFGFEERFRGSEEDIKARQRVYVEYFQWA